MKNYILFPNRLVDKMASLTSHEKSIFDILDIDQFNIKKSFVRGEMSGFFSRSDFFTKRYEFQYYDVDTHFYERLSETPDGKELLDIVDDVLKSSKEELSNILDISLDDFFFRCRVWKYVQEEDNHICVKPHFDTSICNMFYYDSDSALYIHQEDTDDKMKLPTNYEKDALVIFGAHIEKYNKDFVPTLHSVQSNQDERTVVNVSMLDKQGYQEYLENALELYSE